MTTPEWIQKRQKELEGKPLEIAKEPTYKMPSGKTVEFSSGPHQYVGEGLPGGWETTSSYKMAPNYEKLTRAERWVMDKLPGFAESGVGKALAWFGNTPVGKALGFLDIAAEGVERTVGFVSQWEEASHDPETFKEFKENLGAAWYAGSLTADFVRAPTRDPITGNLVITEDMPGISGIVDARRQIIELTKQGMSNKEALETVRNSAYEGAGALALRMQINDALFHIVADPMNFIMPYLKPVERLNASIIKKVSGLAVADDVAKITAELGERAAKFPDEAADIAKVIERIEAMEKLSPAQERLLKLTGWMPIENKDSLLGKFLTSKWNPLGVTPASRAAHLGQNVTENILSRVVGEIDDPVEILRTMQRIADGTIGPEFGHMIVSVEGRYVRGIVQKVMSDVEDYTKAFMNTAGERSLFKLISDVTGENVYDVFYQVLRDGEENAVFARLMDNLDDVSAARLEEIRALLGADLDANMLKEAAETFGNTRILDAQSYKIALTNKIMDSATQAAVLKFGVKARGFMEKMSNLVKSAESLAFLRINPAYPIRNFINNEFTMLARGVYGVFSMDSIENFWSKMGFEPVRLYSGYGPAAIAAQEGAADVAAKIINEAQTGEIGWIDRATKSISGVETPIDFGKGAAKIEASASARAMTAGTQRYMREYHALSALPDELISELGEDAGRLQHALESAITNADVDAAVFSSDWNKSYRTIVDTVNQHLGYDIHDVIKPEELEPIINRLISARDKGAAALRDELQFVMKQVDDKLQTQHAEHISDIIAETTARVETEGPGATYKVWHDVHDEFIAAHPQYSIEMSEMADLAKATSKTDAKAGHALWRRINNTARGYWNRTRERMSGHIDGLIEGFRRIEKQTGQRFPFIDQIKRDFDSWMGGWDDFFTWRRQTLDDFWSAKLEGKAFNMTWDQITAETERRYAQAMELEERYLGSADDIVARMLPEEQVPMYKAWRNRVAQARNADRQFVKDFWGQIRDLKGDARRSAIENMWATRRENWAKIYAEEQAGVNAMFGGPLDQLRYKADAEDIRILSQYVSGVKMPLEDKVKAAELFKELATPEELERLDAIRKSEEAVGEISYATQVAHSIEKRNIQSDIFSRLTGTPRRRVYLRSADLRPDEISGLIKLPDGTFIRGEIVGNVDELPETLYHVTASGDAIRQSGSIWAAGGEDLGGIGGGVVSRRGVSMSKNIEDARLIQRELKRVIETSQGAFDIRELSRLGIEDEVLAGLTDGALDGAVRGALNDFRLRAEVVAGRLGIPLEEFTDESDLFERVSYLIKHLPTDDVRRMSVESLRHYRISRDMAGGFVDPIILGDYKVWAKLDPGAVEILNISRDRLADSGGAILKNVQEGDFLSEVRVFGDIPLEEQAAYNVGGLPDLHDIVRREQFTGIGYDQLNYTRGREAMEAVGNAINDSASNPPLRFENLSENGQRILREHLGKVKGELSDARYASVKFGEYMRDSALLNYNRRYNYNTWLGTLAPYEFWVTQSMFKWAIHSIDRPAMLSTYMRMQKFLETAFRPEEGLPSRLRGTIRVKLPFLSTIFGNWLGDEVFVDPLRTALPFKQFSYPFEQMQRQEQGDVAATNNVLKELLNDGKITQQQYDDASSSQQGEVWDRAMSLARQDDTEGRLNGFDFMSTLTSPHAPLLWAYNTMRGKPEDIQPFMPITRTIKGATALLGIGPAGGINPEGAIRKSLGLPAFDKWDDYRIDRMLSNMAATGEITVDQALQAMNRRGGEIFTEAERRAGIEYGIGAMGSTIGLPAKAYPEGEEHLRKLKDEYEQAWTNYENGDADAVQEFYDRYPEYETRLALFKKPEERLRRFVIDEIWSTWNDLPKLSRDEARSQLGEVFQMAFLNKDTRSYEQIPLNTLQVWLKLLGGDPVGKVEYTEPYAPLEFSPPDVAYRMQVFYDTREQRFRYNDQIWPLSETYWKLNSSGRKKFLSDNPILKYYWDWRRDFMERNPDLAPYIEDDPNKWPTYPSEADIPEKPNFTPEELQAYLGGQLWNLVMDYASGEPLPEVARRKLEQLGLSAEEVLASLQGATP